MSTKVSKRYVVNRVIAAGLRTYLAKYETEVEELASREALAKSRSYDDPAMCKSAGCSGSMHKCMAKDDEGMEMAETKPSGCASGMHNPQTGACADHETDKPAKPVKKDDEGMEMAEDDATKVGGRAPVSTSVVARAWKPGTVVGTKPAGLPRRSLATSNLNMGPTRPWEKSEDLDKGAMDMVLGRQPFKAAGTLTPPASPGMTPPGASLKSIHAKLKSPPPPPAAALAVRKSTADDVMSPPHSGPAPKGPACKGCGSKGSHLPSCTTVKKADGVPAAPRAPGAKMQKAQAVAHPRPTDPHGKPSDTDHGEMDTTDYTRATDGCSVPHGTTLCPHGHLAWGLHEGGKRTTTSFAGQAVGLPSPVAPARKAEEDMAKKLPSPIDPIGTSKPAGLPQMHINNKPVIGRVKQLSQRAAAKKPAPIVGGPQNPNVDPTGKPLNPQSLKDRS